MFGGKTSSFLWIYLIAAAIYVCYLLFCIWMRYSRDKTDEGVDKSKNSKRNEKTKVLKSKLDSAQAKIADLEARLSKTMGGLDKLDENLSAELSDDLENNDDADKNLPKNPTEATGLRNRKNNKLPETSKPMSVDDVIEASETAKNADPDTNSDNPISVDELKDILSQVSSLKTLSESYKSGKGW